MNMSHKFFLSLYFAASALYSLSATPPTTFPAAPTLMQQLDAANLGDFAQQTTIVQELAGKTLCTFAAMMAIKLAVDDYYDPENQAPCVSRVDFNKYMSNFLFRFYPALFTWGTSKL